MPLITLAIISILLLLLPEPLTIQSSGRQLKIFSRGKGENSDGMGTGLRTRPWAAYKPVVFNVVLWHLSNATFDPFLILSKLHQ